MEYEIHPTRKTIFTDDDDDDDDDDTKRRFMICRSYRVLSPR